MRKIIISAIAAATTVGTVIAAPAALADDEPPPPAVDTLEDGPFPGPFDGFPGLTREPLYMPSGSSLGVREAHSAHSAYSGPASNPTA